MRNHTQKPVMASGHHPRPLPIKPVSRGERRRGPIPNTLSAPHRRAWKLPGVRDIDPSNPCGTAGAGRVRTGPVTRTDRNSDRARAGGGAPPGLVDAAGWAWRLLVLGVAAYAVVWVLSKIALVVLPLVAAFFLSALLRPVTRLLDRYMPRLAAAWLTLLIAGVVVGGVGYFIGLQAAASAQEVISELIQTLRQLMQRLEQLPMFERIRVQQIQQVIVDWLQHHRQRLTNILVTGARFFAVLVTGLVFMVFIMFFFIYEGERIWGWIVGRLPGRPATRIDRAGQVIWKTVYGWITGTVVIATIHGIVVAIALLLLGVPLVAPLALLVFLGSFIPIVGALVAGGVAVLVTLGTEGLIDAAILTGVLIVENQLEGNLLQPLVMGHYVRLNPLVIGIVLVLGAVLFGIVGAIVAVPAAAVVYRALPELLRPADGEETRTRRQEGGGQLP